MCCMKSVRSHSRQSGYVLLALMLTMTLILVALAMEAPRIGQQIKRGKEEELVHRGKDYDDLRWPRDMQRATVSDIGPTCEQEGIAVPAAA